jgi:hypothetical protein
MAPPVVWFSGAAGECPEVGGELLDGALVGPPLLGLLFGVAFVT